MDKKLFILCLLGLTCFIPTLQAQIKWPEGKKAAVILTYDDNLKSHHEVVMPQLEAKGFRGTFFLYGYPMKAEDIPLWRDVSKRGHELGNHSMFHQCATEVTDAPLCRSLKCYTIKDILAEVRIMKSLLYAIDGKEQYAYAYPCGHSETIDGDYSVPMMEAGLANYGRGAGVVGIVSDFQALNLARVPTISTRAGWSGEKLISYVQEALDKNGMVVFIFHGVGGDYMKVEAEEHQELVNFLAIHPEIWVGTFTEVLDYIAPQIKNR